MLGKLLWCIFEGASGISSCITVETFRETPCAVIFPTFLHTPLKLQDCIRKCTAGAPEWNGRFPGVVRKDNNLYPFEKTEELVGTAETQEAARAWWREEIRDAELFLDVRRRLQAGYVVGEDSIGSVKFMRQRPSLKEVANVVDLLLEIEGKQTGSN